MADLIRSGGDVGRPAGAVPRGDEVGDRALIVTRCCALCGRALRDVGVLLHALGSASRCCLDEQSSPNKWPQPHTAPFEFILHANMSARVHTQASNRAQPKKKKRDRPTEQDPARKVVFKSVLDNPLVVKW